MPRPILTARVDPAVVERVDRCVHALNERAEPGADEADRGDVVRRCIMRALPKLEGELGLMQTAPAVSSKPKQKKKRSAHA